MKLLVSWGVNGVFRGISFIESGDSNILFSVLYLCMLTFDFERNEITTSHVVCVAFKIQLNKELKTQEKYVFIYFSSKFCRQDCRIEYLV